LSPADRVGVHLGEKYRPDKERLVAQRLLMLANRRWTFGAENGVIFH
jgi:hypothetical protein